MAFCKFSTENRKLSGINIDSTFFTDYLPYAPDGCIKVYLYGLKKCYEADEITNTIEDFAENLNLSTEDIKSAFMYWQEQNLVTILNLNPIEVRYLPIQAKKYSAKMFKKDKYEEFNRCVQEMIEGRMITPHEYKEYYITMESMHIDPSAMLMIVKYCIEQKGSGVGYSYILTVAKNWAYDGVHSASDVEAKLDEMEKLTSGVKDILTALKSKRLPTYEDKELYKKWTKQLGFEMDTLIHIAKSIKRGGIEKMAEQIDEYASLNLFSLEDIEHYQKNKEDLLLSAREVCKALGLYYEALDPVVNTYIMKWRQMGYDFDAIKFVANICFKKYIRNFEGMDEIISKYYQNGLVSIDSIEQYVGNALSTDKKIKAILEKLGLKRQVTSWDRDFYHTWIDVWKFDDDMLDYALSLGVGKSQPMAYINKIFSTWKEKGIDTLEKAKAFGGSMSAGQEKAEVKSTSSFMTHSFSNEELNALFDNLDEVKLI